MRSSCYCFLIDLLFPPGPRHETPQYLIFADKAFFTPDGIYYFGLLFPVSGLRVACANTDGCDEGPRDRGNVLIHTATLSRSLSRRGPGAGARKVLEPDTRETQFFTAPEPDSGVSSAQSTGARPWCATCHGDTCGCGQDSIVI